MARKVAPVRKPTPPDTGRDDLAVLHPNQEITLAGRTINVREYGFIAGLRVRAKAAVLTRSLTAQIESGQALTEDVMDVLAVHDELVRELVLDSIAGPDDPAASREALTRWMAGLSDVDGEALLLTWWGVCGPFFVRQIARRLSQALQLKADLAQASAGQTSTPSSPPPDTAPQQSSGATPSAN